MRYKRRFSDVRVAMDEVQGHLNAKIQKPRTNGTADAFCRLQLAVHEWMGNLARHADFGSRLPELHVQIWEQGGCLRCVVEDNSDGFDLDTQLQRQRCALSKTDILPDGGMGLLLMNASTEHAEYDTSESDANRLHLTVALDT